MAKTKEIKIKIEGEDWKKVNQKALDKITKNIKIDGFRKGKAPKEIVIKNYGQQNIWLDAADMCIQDAYKKLLDENQDIEIVTRPDGAINALNDDYVEFLFTLTLRPEVKLGSYKNLGVEKEKTSVTDEEVEESLKNMQSRYAENVSKDTPIEEGDTAIIDFEGFLDDVPFEGGKGENYSLKIGSNTFIPGFEEQLIGMKKDEEKDIHVTFPEDYHAEELKGKPVVFKVKVHDIKTTVIPELNDEFFEDLGMEGITDEKSLKEELKKNIETRKETEAENKFIDAIMDKAVENMEIEIPEPMIQDELDRMVKQYAENLKMQGITLEMFYQFTNSSEEQLKEQLKGEAEKRVASRFLLEEIAKEEKVTIKVEDVEKEVNELAEKYQMPKDEFLEAIGGMEMMEYDMKMRKAIEILKENNEK